MRVRIAASSPSKPHMTVLENLLHSDKEIMHREIKDASTALQFIEKHEITEQDDLVKIVKLAAQQNGKQVSDRIERFGITSQTALEEIAEIVFNQNPVYLIHNLKDYGFKDEAVLVKLAKLTAQKDPLKLPYFIRSFGITNQRALADIAKLAHAEEISWYIHRYGITDQTILGEIAENEYRQKRSTFSGVIENYRLKDQVLLVKLAKLMAQNDDEAWELCQDIRNFGITDQAGLAEIGEILVRRSVDFLLDYLVRCGLTDQPRLLKLAELSVLKDPRATTEGIAKFGITNEADRLAIAKIAAKTEIVATSLIEYYGLKSNVSRLEILAFELLNSSVISEDIIITACKKHLSADFDFSAIHNFPSYLSKTKLKIDSNRDLAARERMQEWLQRQQLCLALILSLCTEKKKADSGERGEVRSSESLEKTSEEAIRKVLSIQDEICLQMSSVGSLEERTKMASELCKLFLDPAKWDFFIGLQAVNPYRLPIALACLSSSDQETMQSFTAQINSISRIDDAPKMRQLCLSLISLSKAKLSADKKSSILKKQFVEHADDLRMFMHQLEIGEQQQESAKKVKNKEQLEILNKQSSELLDAFITSKMSFLKQPKVLNSSQQTNLFHAKSPQANKKQLLQIAFSREKNIQERASLLNTLLSIGCGEEIVKSGNSLSLSELRAILQRQLKDIFKMDPKSFSSEEEFLTAWSTYIEKPLEKRYPDAFFVYAGKINALPEPDQALMQKSFSQFIMAMLQGPEALHKLRSESGHFQAVAELLKILPEDKAAIEKGEVFHKQWSHFPALKELSAYLPEEKPRKSL